MKKHCHICLEELAAHSAVEPSLYHALYHMTEEHPEEAKDFFKDVRIPNPCVECLSPFDAEIRYRPDKQTFLIEKYCEKCNPVRRAFNVAVPFVWEECDRDTLLHLRNQLSFTEEMESKIERREIAEQLPHFSKTYTNFRDNRELHTRGT